MTSLETLLERKVESLVKTYQVAHQGGVSSSDILAYCQQRDPSLKRKKERVLMKIIDECLARFKVEASVLNNQEDEDDESSDDQEETLAEAFQPLLTLNRQNNNEGEDDDCEEVDIDDGAFMMESNPEAGAMGGRKMNYLNRSLRGMYASASSPAIKSSSAPSSSELATHSLKRSLKSASSSSTSEANVETKKDAKRLKQEQKRDRKLEKWGAPSAKLSDMGGIDGCVEEILQLIAMPLQHPEIYLHLGIQPPRGILLHGPPGTGKTFLAHAIAGELQVPFLNISAPSIVSGMSGESEKKLREVFDEAKMLAPCLLFIDEIDAITPKRENAQREMERRIVAQLLTCMDDLSLEKTNNKPVIIIGATNRPDSLDPALRRAGRFDREISMGVPDQNARGRILEKLSLKLRLGPDFDIDQIAKLTPGFVGADLKALISEAGIIAVKRIFRSLLSHQKHEKFGKDIFDEDNLESNELDEMEVELENLITNQISVSEFLSSRQKALTSAELGGLFICKQDFLDALKKVQPSAKREGFATVPNVSWEDVGALERVRDELRMAIVEPIKHPEYFERVGITAPMGVLLYGPPGCGKTLLAKAVANESMCNFISVKGPELLNKYVGESERAVRTVFARAQSSSPCVIFFDELDALCPSRSSDSESQSSSRLVNTLLTEMDGMQGRRQVYVIAATNRPDMIDQAMLRPGRLDKTLYVDLPTAPERAEIMKTLARKAPLAPNVSLEALAHDTRCEGLSGADLAALVREASVLALRSKLLFSASEVTLATEDAEILVTRDHFSQAFDKITPSVSKRDRKRYELLRAKFGSASKSAREEETEADAPAK